MESIKSGRAHSSRGTTGKKIRKSISLNLLNKFESVREPKKIDFELLQEFNPKHNNVTNEELLNEIQNKVISYKQRVTFAEEMNNTYISEVQNFLNYFAIVFEKIYPHHNLNQLKNSFATVENLVNMNMDLLYSSIKDGSTTARIPDTILQRKEAFLISLTSYFQILNDNVKFEKDRSIIDKMGRFIEQLKDYVLLSDINNNFPKNLVKDENLITESLNNIGELTATKNKKADKRRDQLNQTVYLNKTKSVQTNHIDEEKHKHLIEKTERLFLRNFLQIYLVKENGIFSESSFSRCGKNGLESYKKYNFYEVKFYISLGEDIKDIKVYINQTRALFSKYIVLYKHQEDKNFIKLVFSGIGKRQSVMKRNIINFMSGIVKKDCLFKISLFSNIYDCISANLTRYKNNHHYFMYSRFPGSLLRKIHPSIYPHDF